LTDLAKQIKMLGSEKLAGTDIELPYVIVADEMSDEAFPLKCYIQ
jgi:hypothetical protein